MTFKRLTSPSAGDSTHFGGLDVNKFSDYFGGTDIGASETIDIATLTAFRNSKFSLRNPANTFSYVYVPSAIAANRNITLPLLTGNDQVTMDNHPTTLTNKTIAYGSNTITGLPSTGGGKATYKYTIWKNGSNYEAVNNDTGTIDSTNTDARTVIQFAIDAVATAGGGSLLFRANTTYVIASTLFAKNNVCLVGEEKMTTILNGTSSSVMIWDNNALITGFGLMNLTLKDTNSTGTELIDFDGTVDCYFYNNRFIRTTTPIANQFIVYFGDNAETATNLRLIFHNNYLTGNTFGEDMFGCGNMVYCDISHNFWENSTGQAIGINGTIGSHYDDNSIFNVASSTIAFEGITSEGNTVCNNTLISNGGDILLSQSANQNTHLSRSNIVSGNVFWYGNQGIANGNGKFDIITNNVFYRTKRHGIYGCFERCTITNNHFIETNYNWDTWAGSEGRSGGVEFYNNTLFSGPHNYNKIANNIFHDTGVSFTIPTGYISGGTTQTGHTGGVMIDTDFSKTLVYENTFDTQEPSRRLYDLGQSTKIWDNNGIILDNVGIASLPSRRAYGAYFGTVAIGASGLFNDGMATAPASSSTTTQYNSTYGRNRRHTSGATAGNNAGIRYAQTVTQRALMPRFKCRFALAQTGTNQRLMIGLRGDVAADASNDNDPLATEAGIMLALRSTDTVFQIVRNDTSGASVYSAVTGSPAVDTNIHTIEIIGDGDDDKFSVFWDGGAGTVYKTDIPNDTDQLGTMCMIQTATTAAKSLDLFYMELETGAG